MSDENIPPLLTAEQVAEILAVSVSTLRKNCSVCKESVPPFLKLGKQANSSIRWRRCDVDKWIETQFYANNTDSGFQSLLDKAEVSS